MRLKRTREVLQQFGKYVVTQSRSALTKKKKTLSGSLYDSLQYIVEDTEDGLKVSFNMNDYGKFVDKGVSGKEEKHNTPYSFTNKKPPMKPLMEWAKARRFRLRDEKGRYEKGNYKTIGFILHVWFERKLLTYLVIGAWLAASIPILIHFLVSS